MDFKRKPNHKYRIEAAEEKRMKNDFLSADADNLTLIQIHILILFMTMWLLKDKLNAFEGVPGI